MNLADSGLPGLAVKALEKQKYYTLEELPDTYEGLRKVKGVGDKRAREILDIKKRVAAAKGAPEPAAPEPEPVAPPPAKAAPKPIEEDEAVFPTARWTKYHMACLAGLDRHLGRILPRWCYAYLTSLANGTDRAAATAAAGMEGALKADRACEKAVLAMCEEFTLKQARDFGPPAGSVAP